MKKDSKRMMIRKESKINDKRGDRNSNKNNEKET